MGGSSENMTRFYIGVIAAIAALVSSLSSAWLVNYYNKFNMLKLIESNNKNIEKTINGNKEVAEITNKNNLEINQRIIRTNLLGIEKNVKGNLEAVKLTNETSLKNVDRTIKNNQEAIEKNNQFGIEKEKREEERLKFEATRLLILDISYRIAILEKYTVFMQKAKTDFEGTGIFSPYLQWNMHEVFMKIYPLEPPQKISSALPFDCLMKIDLFYKTISNLQKMINNFDASLKHFQPTEVLRFRQMLEHIGTVDNKIDDVLGEMAFLTHLIAIENTILMITESLSLGHYGVACLQRDVTNDLKTADYNEKKAAEYQIKYQEIKNSVEIKSNKFIDEYKDILKKISVQMGRSFPPTWNKYFLTK